MTRITFIPVRNKPITLLARNPVFKAFAAGKHMAQPQQTNLALDARQAFDSVEHGTGDAYHRDILAGTANVVMVLAEKHFQPKTLRRPNSPNAPCGGPTVASSPVSAGTLTARAA
jgi:hypothetical protein